MEEFRVRTVEDLVPVARAIATKPLRAVLLDGPMGAGKTTLVKAVCRELGVSDPVNSPTFSLVNEYRLPNGEPLYHFDLYRVESEDEVLDMGWWEYVDSGHWCLIEWPGKIPNLLPESALLVSLSVENGERLVHLQSDI